jgi:hypothetical protein
VIIIQPGLTPAPHRAKKSSPASTGKLVPVKRSEFIHQLQQELLKHHFDTFVDEPPSVASGGRGIVAPGCTLCRVRINTTRAFLDHLLLEILPSTVEKILGHSSS